MITEKQVNFFLKLAMVTSILELVICNYIQYDRFSIWAVTLQAIKEDKWMSYFHFLHLFWFGQFIAAIFSIIIINGAWKRYYPILLIYVWTTYYYQWFAFNYFLKYHHVESWKYASSQIMTGIISLNMLVGLLALAVWLLWLFRDKNRNNKPQSIVA